VLREERFEIVGAGDLQSGKFCRTTVVAEAGRDVAHSAEEVDTERGGNVSADDMAPSVLP